MGKIGSLILIFAGEIDYVFDYFSLDIEDLFQACTFRFKAFCELFYLLIFENSICVSLILNLFELNFV